MMTPLESVIRRSGGYIWRPSRITICWPVVRQVNVAEAYSLGAQKVLQVFMAVDELDGPREITPQTGGDYPMKLLFIGTWMPERGPFLQELLQAGVPLAIYGNDWQKAPEWPALQAAWQGPAIYGDDYIKAIQLAKISLGLLSKGNRDLHTTRTFEIPYAGGYCVPNEPQNTWHYMRKMLKRCTGVMWRSAWINAKSFSMTIKSENRNCRKWKITMSAQRHFQ